MSKRHSFNVVGFLTHGGLEIFYQIPEPDNQDTPPSINIGRSARSEVEYYGTGILTSLHNEVTENQTGLRPNEKAEDTSEILAYVQKMAEVAADQELIRRQRILLSQVK